MEEYEERKVVKFVRKEQWQVIFEHRKRVVRRKSHEVD
jgi:hypothetical protein